MFGVIKKRRDPFERVSTGEEKTMKTLFCMPLMKTVAFVLVLGMSSVSPVQAADIWPIFESGKDAMTVIYPFYVREGKFLMLFPLYCQTNEGRDKHFLWPMVKISDRQPKRIAPVWFANQDSFTLFPIIHQNQKAVTWFIPPVYIKKDGSFSAVFPFYAKGENTLYVFPSYYHAKTNYSETLNVFPFYERIRSNDQVKTSFFPFFSTEWAASKEKDEKKETVQIEILGPLYSKKTVRNQSGLLLERERNFLIFSDVLNSKGERSLKILGAVMAERIQ